MAKIVMNKVKQRPLILNKLKAIVKLLTVKKMLAVTDYEDYEDFLLRATSQERQALINYKDNLETKAKEIYQDFVSGKSTNVKKEKLDELLKLV